MFKVLSAFTASVILASMALAKGPAAKVEVRTSVEPADIAEVAKKTGKSEEQVRKELIEAFRKSGTVSEADLKRIGREKVDFDPAKSSAAVNLLKASKGFSARTGLASMKVEAISAKAGTAFDALAEKPAAKVEKVEPKVQVKFNRDVAIVARVEKIISKEAAKVIAEAPEADYAGLLKLGKILTKRVSNGQIEVAVAEGLMKDAAESTKVLGETVLGQKANEACLNMSPEAIRNLAEFVRGGAREGKDAETYTKGMARAAAEKFKQSQEEGLARVCALAGAGCKLFSNPIIKACKSAKI